MILLSLFFFQIFFTSGMLMKYPIFSALI